MLQYKGKTPWTGMLLLLMCLVLSAALAQGPKRNRDEGMAQFVCSNTTGAGNAWLTLRGIGFMWASKPDPSVPTLPFIFGEVNSEIGLTGYASLLAASRIISYTWNHWPQFGNVVIGTKLTLPDNRELRFRGYGLELKYIYNTTPNFASLGGYRVGGTGFNAEGYTVEGGNLQFKLIHDMDFISRISWLPLKAGINAGMRIPFSKEVSSDRHYVLTQYLLDAGVMWTGLGFDIFAEYSLEAFNNLFGPIRIIGLNSPEEPYRIMEVYFPENPMFVTIGGRIRYDNGVTLCAYIPLLISKNIGSSMTRADDDKWNKDPNAFADERTRGIKNAFDPWFAKWKIVGELTFPVLYRQTGSEMMRNFLLLKNKGGTKKIDIDEQLKAGSAAPDTTAAGEKDKKKRLEDIKKRREAIQKSE
jgi:hypothetical protein